MKRKIEEELTLLIGQPFSDMMRYGGCQKFEFGEQRPSTNRKGQETALGDWGLVVACDWRITQRGEKVICYDDFGPGYERRDENGPAFYELLKAKPPFVAEINVDEGGGLIFRLTDGFVLEVIPRREAETERWAIHGEFRESLLTDGESWRFMPKEEEELPHFVVTTSGIEDPDRAVPRRKRRGPLESGEAGCRLR